MAATLCGMSVHGVQIAAHGGPEQMNVVELPDPEPEAGMLLVEVAAAGVNFIDTYHRGGLYPMQLPLVLGMEGAGTVTATGEGVGDVRPGDRVCWLDCLGSYATRMLVPADRAVPVPERVPLDLAAAVMLQGVTAQYLSTDTYPLATGDICLIHAGAGGVGLLLIQMAKRAGARVITTVGSPDKAELARRAGADHVIAYRDEDFGAAVERLVGPHAVDVVYDGVGRATFARGLDVLRPRGLMASFGNASGPVDPVAPLLLMDKGSLFLTRPSLRDYVAATEELRHRAGAVLAAVAAGELDVRIGARFPLSQARQAHEVLQGRRTTGKVLLTTDH